jgi:glycosyltransferase involved in cell wall biosynthesis
MDDAAAPLLTVVLPVRNRGGARLGNCLRSLRWQRGFASGEVEILVSDYGSDPDAHRDVVRQAAEHGARVCFTDTKGLWNRSRALNAGLESARGRFSLCSDVDMIYEPGFLRAAVDAQLERDGRALVLCQALDLGPETRDACVALSDVPALRATTTTRPTSGLGGCQCAETAWFRRVRGYDEVYRYWGAEDKDLAQRAERDGLALVWITDRTAMLHQWHPTTKYDRPAIVWANRKWLRWTGRIVRKNWLGWSG